ncbi:MAG: hypothetical protein HJJLKODD_01190 [Phycisphaerae bacterium]|nr:hypothetical protein [Phycisphaerae bacterium]
MNGLLATLFLDPLPLMGWQRGLLLLPLCLAVSVVYKAIKLPDLRNLPLASAGLWIMMVVGMWAVALVMWLMYQLFA